MDAEKPELTVDIGDDGLLTGAQVNAFLAIGSTTRLKLAKAGHLELVRIGKSARYTKRSVRSVARRGAP